MENIIDFRADRPITTETDIEAEDDRDTLFAEGFRDIESRLCDCVSMAQLAFEQVCDLKTGDPITENRELLFAVAHTWEMLSKLKQDYYATYHNEKSGGLHTSNV